MGTIDAFLYKASEKIDPDGQGPEAQNKNQNKQDLNEQERVRPMGA